MSNPEKLPGSIPPAGQQGEFPPPPQGPPHFQQSSEQHNPLLEQQHQQYPQEQQFQQQQQQYPQQQQYSSQPPNTAQGQPYSEQQQQYQPPPQQTSQQPYQQPYQQTYQQPPQESHNQQLPPQQQQQHQEQAYVIPPYNPAAPVFAPPPNSTHDNSTLPDGSAAASHGQSTAPQSQPHQSHASEDLSSHQKTGWGERLSHLGMKAAAPINSIAHKLGSQSFLPETLDKECDKAAVILKAFCKKGVYADPKESKIPTSVDPAAAESSDAIIDPMREKPKSRVLVMIPPKVISKAVGLAIFTTLRAGFQVSGATGSGILIARLPDGSWSPPSGIQLHSIGGGFQIGLDIYDCVCVINNKDALAAFMNTRVSLGSDLAVVAGPYGAGAAVDFGTALDSNSKGKSADPTAEQQAQQQSLHPPEKSDKKSHRRSLSASAVRPVFSYVKSRGFYAGIRIDGTVVAERKEANAAFYGQNVAVEHILKGQVPQQGPTGMWPSGAQSLLSVLKGAEFGAVGASMSQGAAQTQPPMASSNIPVAGTAPGGNIPAMHADPSSVPPPVYSNQGYGPVDGDVKYR